MNLRTLSGRYHIEFSTSCLLPVWVTLRLYVQVKAAGLQQHLEEVWAWTQEQLRSLMPLTVGHKWRVWRVMSSLFCAGVRVCVCVLYQLKGRHCCWEAAWMFWFKIGTEQNRNHSCGQNFPRLGLYVGNSIVPSSHNTLVIFFPCGCLLWLVTLGIVPAVSLWHQSGASRPSYNLRPLCQHLTSCSCFLLLVFWLDVICFRWLCIQREKKVFEEKGRWRTKRVKSRDHRLFLWSDFKAESWFIFEVLCH